MKLLDPIPTDIGFYKPITDFLDTLVGEVLAGRHQMVSQRYLYVPHRACPDLDHRLTDDFPIQFDAYSQQNRYQLVESITALALPIMQRLLGGEWEQGGSFWYPAQNGWMDWHAHPDFSRHELRIYFVWCEEAGKARFVWSQDNGKTINGPYEPQGWSVNVFNVGDRQHLYWHGVDGGGTNRLSFGFRPKTKLRGTSRITSQTALIYGNKD